MPKTYDIRSQAELDKFVSDIRHMWIQGKRNIRCEMLETTGTRTLTQNNALHLWLEWLARDLNDAGLDMKAFPWSEGIDVPWTQTSAKEKLWKPVQEAMLDKESTTECNKLEYSDIQETLTRFLAQKLPGFVPPPWPSQDTKAGRVA